ncbi:hypothetical protein BSFA1_81170 (plasmid) [Burkholderia sp. SFA1]|uniref:Uncharacterized protein n=1 Tax=Burkholderia vietnamiensis (strain G4 / LMG 22486) TaxID=269482 RepID=A4JUD5_BURVG|nr:hypothetical protein Bcep1808_7002 [Burkholderia vietnamiensis G4]AET95372.1 hypothetical protein BYI23_E002110 [Burkholderia sp. YI23]MCB4349950.1 hypothetical protein [Burkholderia vietnamiensis]BBQ02989.1 hypothetical protein BSFA1_81170 [Burkholderia sp. SFA1]
MFHDQRKKAIEEIRVRARRDAQRDHVDGRYRTMPPPDLLGLDRVHYATAYDLAHPDGVEGEAQRLDPTAAVLLAV